MGDISLEVSELFSRVQHYLTHQKQNPESAMALEESLIDHVNRLTYQDLMTPVPSGENLLAHFISMLYENNTPAHHNNFIFSALMERSLFFRLEYPYLPDATTFLLTSSNQNNQTPFQLIESIQNKDLLGSYLRQVERHLSRPLVANDVVENKCTPWSCPLASSVLFFEKLRSDGFRLLDKLVLLHAKEHFIAALDVLRAAFTGGYISGDAYKNVLLTHPKRNHSLLHELTMAGNVDKLEAYLRAINTMHREHVIDTNEYKNIFCVFNRAGYSAVHQAVNAPNEDIARSFLFFLENKCSLPASQKKEIFKIRSINRKAVLPRRDKAKQDASVDEINDEMTRLSRAWQVGEQAQYLQVQRLFSVSNPASLKIEIESESEATETGSWSPWKSPVLWSPSSLN